MVQLQAPISLFERTLRTDTSVKSAISCNEAFLDRLCKSKTLEGHGGCVNTVTFNQSGSKVISGSDDKLIKLWDYYTGRELTSFHSKHTNNVFQAHMKADDEATIITCAADGRVRVTSLGADGEPAASKLLCSHKDRAHKLAMCPHEPNSFYSCGEDGRVYLHDLRCSGPQALLTCSKAGAEQRFPMALYSIHCNPLRPEQFVVGGRDASTRVYDQRFSIHGVIGSKHDSNARGMCMAAPIRSLVPKEVRDGNGRAHVTCAVFTKDGSIISSYGNGDIYQFRAETAAQRAAKAAHQSKRKREYQSSAAEKPSKIASPKTKAQKKPQQTVEAVASEAEPASSLRDLSDVAQPLPSGTKEIDEASASHVSGSSANAAVAQQHQETGDAVSEVLRGGSETKAAVETLIASSDFCRVTQEPPQRSRQIAEQQEFAVNIPEASASRQHTPTAISAEGYAEAMQEFRPSDDEFDTAYSGSDEVVEQEEDPWRNYFEPDDNREEIDLRDDADDEVLMKYSGHRNNVTVKSVATLGHNDEYVMSGSDCGHIFIWRRSDGKLCQLLEGDSDVVNCLAQHPSEPISFATSGIEDTIKLWAPERLEANSLDLAEAGKLENRNRASSNADRHSRLPTFIEAMVLNRLLSNSRLDVQMRNAGEADAELIFDDEDITDESDDDDIDESEDEDEDEDFDVDAEDLHEQQRRRQVILARLRQNVLESLE